MSFFLIQFTLATTCRSAVTICYKGYSNLNPVKFCPKFLDISPNYHSFILITCLFVNFTESLNKYCTWLCEFPLIFPKLADRQRVAGLTPLAALKQEISKTCKPLACTYNIGQRLAAAFSSPHAASKHAAATVFDTKKLAATLWSIAFGQKSGIRLLAFWLGRAASSPLHELQGVQKLVSQLGQLINLLYRE